MAAMVVYSRSHVSASAHADRTLGAARTLPPTVTGSPYRRGVTSTVHFRAIRSTYRLDVIQFLWFGLVVVVVIAVWKSGLARQLLAGITKVTAGPSGVSFEFTQASALKTKDSVERSLEPIRSTIDQGVEAEVRARSLQQVFGTILDGRMGPGPYRATVHIPDPLFENWLYQVLDYHPQGSGRGRRFDSRAGIIGLAWRTGQTQALPDAANLTIAQLIENWSMTRREAAARTREAYGALLAVLLTDPEGPRQVGVLYLDSTDPNRFGVGRDAMIDFGTQLAAACTPALTRPLTELATSVLRSSPQITLEKLT